MGCNLHMLLRIHWTLLCRNFFPYNIRKGFFCPSSRLIIFQTLSRGCFNLLAPIFGWAEHSAGVSKSRLWFQPPVHPPSHEAVPSNCFRVSSLIHKLPGRFWCKCLTRFINALTNSLYMLSFSNSLYNVPGFSRYTAGAQWMFAVLRPWKQ